MALSVCECVCVCAHACVHICMVTRACRYVGHMFGHGGLCIHVCMQSVCMCGPLALQFSKTSITQSTALDPLFIGLEAEDCP